MKSSSRKVRLSRFNRGIDWVDPGCGLQLGGFIPTALVIPFLSLDFFTHEISEWAYERTNGVQGSSALFGLLVDTTANVGQIGLYVLLIAYAYDQGWQKALGLYAILFVTGLLMQLVPIVLKRMSPDALLAFRLACLTGVYTTLFLVSYQLSWFGLLPLNTV